MEAAKKNEISRVTARWARYEVLVVDEMGYVALADAGAELLFQVIAGEGGTGGRDRDYQSPIFRVDHHGSECATMQGDGGPADRPGPYYRDRKGIDRFRRTLEKKKGGKG